MKRMGALLDGEYGRGKAEDVRGLGMGLGGERGNRLVRRNARRPVDFDAH